MTQDIRELLELAALACGGLVYVDSVGSWIHIAEDGTRGAWWNPLDDGDGARMETTLNLNVSRLSSGVQVSEANSTWCLCEDYADHNGNRQAARLMASLRVAAEIGRRMKG